MFRIRHVLDSENHYQTSENHGRIAVSEDSYGTDGRWRPLPMTRTRASRSRARRLGVVLAVAVLALAGLLSFLQVEPPAVTSNPRASAESSFLFGAVGDFDGVNDPDMLGLARRLDAAGGRFLIGLGDLGYTSDEPGWCASIKGAFNDVLVLAGNHDTGESTGGDITQFVIYCPFTLGVPLTAGPSSMGYGAEYYFDYPSGTPLARFIEISAGVTGSLGYNYGVGSTHYDWVVTAVNDARSRGIPWVIVSLHKNCITVGSKTSCAMGQAMFDKLVDLKVDLILQGHDHVYERSRQLALGPACTTVPSAGGFDADCIVDDGSDSHYPKGTGTVVVVNGAGGRDTYNVNLGGGDGEIGYFAQVMGNNANTQGRTNGHGTVIFNVTAQTIVAETDYCPLGSTGSDGQCPAQKPNVFRDTFQIGGTPPPPPPPVEIPVGAFRGRYFDNADLTVQRLERVDAAVNFDWGAGSPDPSVAADTFSVRWEGYWDFATTGVYRFTSRTDDGMRISIDNVSLLDAWKLQAVTTYTNDTTLVAGRHFIKIEFFDQTNQAIAQVSWAFVSSPPPTDPVARFTRAPVYAQPNATVTFDASSSVPSDPNATLEARWDWEDDGVWDAPWSSALTAQHAYAAAGRYTVRLEVRDSTGKTDNETATMVIDGTPPTTTASPSGTVGADGWYRSSVSVTLSAVDDLAGVAGTLSRVDGAAWQTYSGPVPVTGDGSHQVEFRSTDAAGNAESARNISFRIDATYPVTTHGLAGTLGGSDWYTGPVDVSLTASDATSGVASTSFRVDGGAWQPYADPVRVIGNGSHKVDYASTDLAGNAETPRSVVFQIGPVVEPPASTLSVSATPEPSGWYVAPVTVTLTGTSPSGSPVTIHVRIDGGSWAVYTEPISLGEGDHTLEYYAADATGATEPSRSLAIPVDLTPPLTAVTLLGTRGRGVWFVSLVTVSLAASDATSGVASIGYRLDGGAWQSYAASFVVGDGHHVLEVQARDQAGLLEALQTVRIKVDVDPPSLRSLGPSRIVTSSSVLVAWNATDAVSGVAVYEVSVDGAPFANLSLAEDVALSFADGEHYVIVRATDAAGNSATEVISFRVDTNVFSPTGPMSGLPTYLLIELALVLAGVALLVRWRRRRRARLGL